MNENKKLDIIRSMLHTLLGDSDKERKDENDIDEDVADENNNPLHCPPRGDHRNVCNNTEKEQKERNNLKKKYVEKSKEVISFYRNYMNKSEQKELEKYANLYDIVLNNSFEHTERDSIDTYMYCNVFPMLKKTFDAFVVYVAKLNEHKYDESYTKVIKNFDPILLFSQYIIRLTDEDFSQSDKENSLFEEELSGCFSPGGDFQKKGTLELDKLIHDQCFVTTGEMPTNGIDLDPTRGKKKDAELTQVEKEINDFYNNYDMVEEENKLKRTQKRRDILKSIYSKKNVLTADEIALYNSYYEERIKVRGKKVLTGRRDSSLILNFAATNSFGNVAVAPNAFNITLDLEEARGGKCDDANSGELQVKEKGHPNVNPPCDDHPDGVGENLDELIKQLERRESSYFEKRIHFVLDKWVREEDGRRLIINQKDKIKLIFDEFKKKNYTITDKDIIPLLFFIDKKLFLNYTLVHQYNFNNFHYIFFLHSSFYCSDTNSITFEELWTFLVSNLPLNSHLYKEDILIGLEKFYRKKKMVRNFQFTITFVKNFLLFLLMDMFLFLSRFVKQELSHHPVGPLRGSENLGGISLAGNFYLHMDSLSPFFSSSEGSSTETFSSMGKFRSVCAYPSVHQDSSTQVIDGGDVLPENNPSQKTLPPFTPNEDEQLEHNHSENNPQTLHTEGCVKRNLLLHLLMLLWGINIKMDGLQEEVLISDELSTDMEGEAADTIDTVDAVDVDDALGQPALAKPYEDAPAPEGGGKPLHRRAHQQIYPHSKKNAHECTCKSDGEIAKKGIPNRFSKRVPPQKRSLSTDGWNKQYRLKKTSVEDAIRSKKKINEDELEEEKNRKEKKRTHNMYTLRKKYKKKNYKKKLSILVHSIVKNIKPRKKNYYNKLLQMLNGGAKKKVFWDLFLFPLEGYDQFTTEHDIGWALHGVDSTATMSTDGHSTFRENASGGGSNNHLGGSLDGRHSFRSTNSLTTPCGMHTFNGGEGDPSKIPFFPEDEIFPQVENFIQTYIKKKRKRKSSDGDHKMGDTTMEEVKSSASSKKSNDSSIRLLCSFRLYKKKFLNKFTTEHIYLLLLFVCYVNKTMDSFFLRRAGTKGK
ncbi:Uncharacterized protein PCOAH_00008040 [Plasmodium coatneyi]|uniref:Uncharacterized protein n=1 Tax=Plasmodium coatneyi TaxID=208452 RepID=A0A1B1DV86_9APIC|nr:Uncharacterized protein PCOAH_00008040 [Plasmodium coatneyi]ANQ06495.1 Uncharacterized protein PCOAH_00008040 [Plasmodium coatneyi]